MNKGPQKGKKEDLISALADTRERLAKAEHLLLIEEAVGRIRARTLTMRSSEEMAQVIELVFQELQGLGFENQTCALAIIDANTHDSEVWRISNLNDSDLNDKVGASYFVPYFDHPVYKNILRGWQDQSSFIIVELEGDSLVSYYTHLFENTGYSQLSADQQQALLNTLQIVWTIVFMKHGTLAVIDYGLSARALDESRIAILRKVARAFDMTYTRFLDLQDAETRAREAEHETSVTRIRAEIAAMKSTSDLERISTMLWQELTSFNVSFIRCGIVLIHEKEASMQVFLTRDDGSTFNPFHIPFQSLPIFPRTVVAWQKQEIYTEQWDKEGYYAWAEFLIQHGVMLVEDREFFEEAAIGGVHLTFIPFVYGNLYVGSQHPLTTEQINHLKLLADAFSVAFARYNDFKLLETKNQELASALNHLETTQSQLVQSEKLASLGKLTAGIAHEIKNPLNFVNNFAEISIDLAEELEATLKDGEDIGTILEDLKQNAQQITKHGRRAAGIVNSMVQHASGSQGEPQEVEVNTFVAEYINLAYHGMRARTSDFNTAIHQDFDEKAGMVKIIPQEIGRVLINLFNNAFHAMHERTVHERSVHERTVHERTVHERTVHESADYKPELSVSTRRIKGWVEICVTDNGPGISPKVQERIFEPFFTTKPAGSGTGLGLSLSFDIITQGHDGKLTVKSEPGKGTTFKISLPA